MHVRIGPINYELQLVPDLNENGKTTGAIRYRDCIIVLDADLSPQARVQTLWHEVLHGIMGHLNIKDDEAMIDRLSYAVMELLQDNLWLATWNGSTIHGDNNTS